MRSFQPYLNFDGNARDAMTFYQQCLGADLDIQTFADAHMQGPPGLANRVMHARLSKGPAVLMASDTMPGSTFTPGNSSWVNVDCESVAEIDNLFAAFSQGATVVMPLDNTFWNARFGMLTDKFGINWMFNHELPKKD